MSIRRMLSTTLALSLTVMLAGCPMPEPDQDAAVQRAAVASEAMSYLEQASAFALQQALVSAPAPLTRQAPTQQDVDEVVDFDAVDGQGQDRYPDVTGQVRVFGTAAVTPGPYGYTFTADAVGFEFLSAFRADAPGLGAAVEVVRGARFACSAEGSFSLTDGGVEGTDPRALQSELTLRTSSWNSYMLNDGTFAFPRLSARLLLPGREPVQATLSVEGHTGLSCTDDDVDQEPPAVMHYDIDQLAGVSWTSGFRFVSVQLRVEADSAAQPPVDRVTTHVGGQNLGIMGIDDFSESYGAPPLAPLTGLCPLLAGVSAR